MPLANFAIETSVASGRYLNASEVVREGLRLLEEKTRQGALKLKGLREAAAAGFEAIDRSEFEEVSADAIGATVRAIGRRAGIRRHAQVGGVGIRCSVQTRDTLR